MLKRHRWDTGTPGQATTTWLKTVALLRFVAGSAVAAQGDHFQLGPRSLAVFRTP